jgi:hypothetical protein
MDTSALTLQSEIRNLKPEIFKAAGILPVLSHPSGTAITHGHLTSFNNHRHVPDTFRIL